MTGEPKVVCAGTLSRITCYNIRSLTLDGYGERAASCRMLGNDAVIAARLLHAAGTSAACLLLGPSRDDVAVLQAEEPDLTVLTAGLRPGPVTESAVLQDADGRRYWLLPPRRPGDFPLPLSETASSALVYADMYDEIEDAILGWLAEARPDGLVINLSASRHTEKAAKLAPLCPLLIQASVPHVTPSPVAARTARELRGLARARYALVSAGRQGFTMAGPEEKTWARIPARLTQAPALGAGAALSAGILHGLAHGDDGGSLSDTASAWAADYLKGAPV